MLTIMFRALVVVCFLHSSLGAVPRLKKPRLDGRIVGGEQVEITDYPYQAFPIMMDYSHQPANSPKSPTWTWSPQAAVELLEVYICGATIIGSRHALSSAHCFSGFTADDLTLRVGSSMLVTGGLLYHLKNVTVPEQFDNTRLDYDIAIFEIDGEFALGANISAVGLASRVPAVGELVRVSGWGGTSQVEFHSDTLHAVSVPVVDQHSCYTIYADVGGVTDRMFCAGLAEGGKGFCVSDNGDPAVGPDGTLAGLASWGKGCGQPGLPGVYTSIPAYRAWILEVTGI